MEVVPTPIEVTSTVTDVSPSVQSSAGDPFYDALMASSKDEEVPLRDKILSVFTHEVDELVEKQKQAFLTQLEALPQDDPDLKNGIRFIMVGIVETMDQPRRDSTELLEILNKAGFTCRIQSESVLTSQSKAGVASAASSSDDGTALSKKQAIKERNEMFRLACEAYDREHSLPAKKSSNEAVSLARLSRAIQSCDAAAVNAIADAFKEESGEYPSSTALTTSRVWPQPTDHSTESIQAGIDTLSLSRHMVDAARKMAEQQCSWDHAAAASGLEVLEVSAETKRVSASSLSSASSLPDCLHVPAETGNA